MIEASICIHMEGKEYEFGTQLWAVFTESLTLQPKSCVFLLPGPSLKGETSW